MGVKSPILKRYRRLGESFALSADRALTEKHKKAHRKLPPGPHGRKAAFRKMTQYGLQLLEKQKLKLFYGLRERQLKNLYSRASRTKGATSEKLIELLERRLDNIIYRAGLTDSHRAARQLTAHRHLTVNGRITNIASFTVKPKDLISVRRGQGNLPTTLRETAERNKVLAPAWLKVDPQSLTIEVVRLPQRGEVEVPFNEELIVEFYSR